MKYLSYICIQLLIVSNELHLFSEIWEKLHTLSILRKHVNAPSQQHSMGGAEKPKALSHSDVHPPSAPPAGVTCVKTGGRTYV